MGEDKPKAIITIQGPLGGALIGSITVNADTLSPEALYIAISAVQEAFKKSVGEDAVS